MLFESWCGCDAHSQCQRLEAGRLITAAAKERRSNVNSTGPTKSEYSIIESRYQVATVDGHLTFSIFNYGKRCNAKDFGVQTCFRCNVSETSRSCRRCTVWIDERNRNSSGFRSGRELGSYL